MDTWNISEGELFDAVLHCAQEAFGDLNFRIEVSEKPSVMGGDARVAVSLGADQATYVAEAKRIQTAAQLSVLRQRLWYAQQPLLLLTGYMTTALAETARKLDIQFLDAVGNAYLKVGESLIWAVGRKRKIDTARLPASSSFGSRDQVMIARSSLNTGTLAGTKVLFAILMQPERFATLTQREIARTVGVGVGTVSEVLSAFETRGWLRVTERVGMTTGRPGRLLEPDLLLQEFAVSYAARLRDKIIVRRFEAPDLKLIEAFTPGPGMLWGGEVAAQRLLGDYHPTNCTVYVEPGQIDEAMKLVVAKYRLKPSPAGNVVIMRKFWSAPNPYDSNGVVPPPMIFAELMTTANTRAVERAAAIRAHWLMHDFR